MNGDINKYRKLLLTNHSDYTDTIKNCCTSEVHMSVVYFTDLHMSSKENIVSKIKKLFYKLSANEIINEKDFVAIKTHFGEYGNIAYTPPVIIHTFVDCVKDLKANPFVTDSTTLYRGSRSNAVDHLKNAAMNGFSLVSCGAPVIIADGLRGNDFKELPAAGKWYSTVKVASAIHDADSMVVVSHVKGHELYGFGGAIKNIAMGCAPPSMKQLLHSDLKPKVKQTLCTSCGACIKRCPAFAIAFDANKKAFINSDKCFGCGECTVICVYNAIPVLWKTDHTTLYERTAEYVNAFMHHKKNKVLFFNFIMNVSPECDCCYWNDIPIVPNIGIVASTDPIAVDKASVDMINKATPLPDSRIAHKDSSKDNIEALYPVKWNYLFEYATSIGAGNMDYELVTI